MKVYVNGRILPSERAISAFDWGLNFGYGLFETIRAYRGVPAFLEDHLERLRGSAVCMGLDTGKLETIDREIEKLIRINGLEKRDSRIKIVLTKGVSMDVTCLPEEPTLVITVTPLDEERLERLKRYGIRATILDGWGGCGRYKTLNHLKNITARLEARRRNTQEGILTTRRGTVLEATASNVFLVEGNTIKTPPLRGGAILPGITRGKIIELAETLGIRPVECSIRKEELYRCDGLFLTNSVFEIVPVRSLDGQGVGSANGLKIIRILQKAFSRLVTRGG